MLRILCVDDDGLVLSVTADLLRDLGHDVVEASDGRSAAQVIDGMPSIDMLITDIHMPGNVGGKELAAIARSKKPGLPVIYFSGLSHVLPAGMDGVVLRKPCSLGELQQAIDGLQA